MVSKTDSVKEYPYARGYKAIADNERNVDRPYDTFARLLEKITKESFVADIGVGSGWLTLGLAKHCAMFYGIDPSEGLLAEALTDANNSGHNNTQLIKGVAADLPFADGTMDLVISLLAPHDTKEAYRVLRPGGHYHIEKVGAGDKRELKSFFGEDDEGPRGYLCTLQPGDRLRTLEAELKEAGLVDVKGEEVYFDQYFSGIDEFVHLLKEVPHTIRNFSEYDDRKALEKIAATLMTDKGLRTTRHEIIITGTKPAKP
ncbi:MAG: methyltransferase domain-containing protein [Candidatus Woesearchaeota archaeon]